MIGGGFVILIRVSLVPCHHLALGIIGSSARGVGNAGRRHQSREVQEGSQTQRGQGLATQGEVGVCYSLKVFIKSHIAHAGHDKLIFILGTIRYGIRVIRRTCTNE